MLTAFLSTLSGRPAWFENAAQLRELVERVHILAISCAPCLYSKVSSPMALLELYFGGHDYDPKDMEYISEKNYHGPDEGERRRILRGYMTRPSAGPPG